MKRLFLSLLSLLIISQVRAETTFDVALIRDGDMLRLKQLEQFFRDELLALTTGEFDVRFHEFDGQWSQQGIKDAFSQAYADDRIDMVLVTGVTANQVGIIRSSFPKPTFLPFVFDAELMQAPLNGFTSGQRNLNYLTDRVDFSEDIISFKRLVRVRQITFFIDGIILAAIPDLVERARQLAADQDVQIHIVTFDQPGDDLAAQIPSESDAIMLAGLPRMPDDDYKQMIDRINELGLPSYSLVGVEAVKQGLLMSDAPPTDWQRLARRNALNMQAVMLGELAGDQPVIFEGKRELTLNMETARRIGLSPRFDVLSEAVLLNPEPEASGPLYSLREVALIAGQQNLDLLAESSAVASAELDVTEARAALFPQLSLGQSFSQRRETPLVQAGQFAERSSDARLGLDQVIYVDDVAANHRISQYQLNDREAGLQQLRLDIIEEATLAYLNVLRARTQLGIRQDNLRLTKSNLQLAQDRVRLGSSSAADVYRWQSRMASDRSSLLQARSQLDQARQLLNRLLNRPLEEAFQLSAVRVDEPFVITEDEFNSLIDNPRMMMRFTDFAVRNGVDNSPEIEQINAQIAVVERLIVNQKRAYWLPDFTLNSSASKNLDQSGAGVNITEDLSDWSVMLNASIPLFEGGARKAALRRSSLDLEQLTLLRQSTEQKIRQRIRASFHEANVSYANISLSEQAAESSRKNLDLVTDSYASGTVSIIDLLDAQNSSLTADLSAANAVYDFLSDIMNVQRSVGQYDFLLSDDEKNAEANRLRDHLSQSNPKAE